MNPLELTHLSPDSGAWTDPSSVQSAERQREEARAIRAAEAARAARDRGRIAWLLEGAGWGCLRPVLDALALALAVLVTRGWPSATSDIGLEVSVVPRLFEAVNDKFSYEAIGGLPLMALRPTHPHGSRFVVKHAFDRLVAASALAILGPVLLLLLALAVKTTSSGPVFFRQRRVGRDGQAFDLLKFRSMRAPRPGEDFAPKAGSAPGGIEGIDRRTPIGRFLRRSSLDELPQLINVLSGDMSLVGPRPERHRVRSGITSWAQVHGLRGQTSLSDRVEWDNFSIEHWSHALDLKILALTVIAVFRDAE